MKMSLTKKITSYSAYIALFVFIIVSKSINTTGYLSGKFFPPNSPVLAGLYPNDFLPWGVIVFLFFGFMFSSFIFDRFAQNRKSVEFVIIFSLVLFLLFSFVGLIGARYIGTWLEYWGKLFDVWSFAWAMGCVGTIGIYKFFVVKSLE